jgi:dipeptidyl aminopeptidase/acylaminoacyl peptidase
MNRSASRRAGGALLLLLTACAGPVLAQAAAKAPPPVAAFFEPARMHSAKLSPSTRWLATVVQPKGERARLVVSDLEDKEPAAVVAQFGRLDVDDVHWVSDDWLVFDTRDVVSRDGKWYGPGLMSVQRDGKRQVLLIKREWDTEYAGTGPRALEANTSFLRVGPPGSNEVILGEYPLDAAREFSHTIPLALNVSSRVRRTLAQGGPSNVDWWTFDAKGRARAAVSIKDDKLNIHQLDLATEKWAVVGQFERLAAGFWPIGVDDSNQLLVEHVNEQGYSALSRFDSKTGRPADEPMVSTPGYSDSISVRQSRTTGATVAFDVLTDARTTVWLDPDMKALQAKVDAMLPDRINRLDCGNCENPAHVVVFSYTDRSPGEFLLFQPGANKWQRLGSRRPDIDPARMAGMAFHRIKARDGAELPVWITRSLDGDPKPRAAVVLVHGGPGSRGTEWGWNEEAQFLASRGYVVIEPEFRGSTGYGDKHYRAGWKQWGQAMQDDVTDALNFAVKSGWVDARRVCIAGASYGGYATLMGLAKDPDQYRCGVAWVGVSDPMLMFSVHWSDVSREIKAHSYTQTIGDPVKDAAMLKANSPLHLAARIKSPVLLAYGRRDRRVPIEHGELMREALRKNGNEPGWIVYDDEGHGWQRPENIIDFWTQVEKFLARHLQ